MKGHRILIVGCGELGTRHLQAVASLNEVVEIEVVDPRPEGLELGGQSRRYERSDVEESEKKWRRTEPDAADVERTQVDDVLFDLGGIDVEGFIDAPGEDAAYGFDAPVAVISLHQEKQGDLKLTIGKNDDTYYARRPGDASVLKLATEAVEKVLKALEEL